VKALKTGAGLISLPIIDQQQVSSKTTWHDGCNGSEQI
jgi:hypothetical protein